MPVQLAALSALVDKPACAERASALSGFFTDAEGDALVLNKWFSAQAMRGSLAEVEALVDHPHFSWTNPNRLRSVVSVFAAGNLEVGLRGGRTESLKDHGFGLWLSRLHSPLIC